MNYSIEALKESGLNKHYLRNSNTGEYCVVIPEMGANLSELVLSLNNKPYSLIEGNRKRTEFSDKDFFKSAHLMPFVNRIENGHYSYDNSEFQLTKNYPEENNACHGFLFDKEFKIVEKAVFDDKCILRLSSTYKGTQPGYPFYFKVDINYMLCGNGLFCKVEIENLESSKIPFGYGWHPFFTLDLPVDNLYLQLPGVEAFEVKENNIPTGDVKVYDRFKSLEKINNEQLDTCFRITNKNIEIAATRLVNKKESAEVVLWQEVGNRKFNFIQVYTPPSRSSIAIEPQTSCIDAFNNKIGLVELEEREKIEMNFGVRIQKYK